MKTIFRFFKWVFNYKSKIEKKDVFYKRKSLASKIFTIIVMILLPVGSIAFGHFVIPISFESFAFVFIAVLTYIALCYYTFEFLMLHGVLGFRNMIISTVEKFADKKLHETVTRNLEVENGEVVVKDERMSKEEYNQIAKDMPNQKRYRRIDLLIGILGVVLAVAFVVVAIIIGANAIIETLMKL